MSGPPGESTRRPGRSGGDCVVADIGGTTLRVGRHIGGGRLVDVRRVEVDGIGRHPDLAADELQGRVLRQLSAELADYVTSPSGHGIAAVGLSFAGPVTDQGWVTAAPTIWGGHVRSVRLGPMLADRLRLPVLVANDVTAAAWRYADTETEPFCLITISSGIGNKVFRRGEVLVHPDGYGGELGHWPVDRAVDALPCDCGGRGHLGAVASGRGMLALARRRAETNHAAFRRSALSELAAGRPAGITTVDLATAIRADDPFAVAVLQGGLRHLASAIGAVFAAIGVRRFILIGGFAVAVGERFAVDLAEELVRTGCFRPDADQIRDMVRLGAEDDDHGLLGIGRMLGSAGGEPRCAP